jgi:hypothetical protein
LLELHRHGVVDVVIWVHVLDVVKSSEEKLSHMLEIIDGSQLLRLLFDLVFIVQHLHLGASKVHWVYDFIVLVAEIEYEF